MGVSKNRGTPKSSILIEFSITFTIHFGVPLFLETSTSNQLLKVLFNPGRLRMPCWAFLEVARLRQMILRLRRESGGGGGPSNSHWLEPVGDKLIKPPK